MDAGIIVAAVSAAIAMGVAAVMLADRKAKKPVANWQENQLVLDVFGAAKAKDWFLERSGGSTEGKQTLVACLTEEMQERLQLRAGQLDPEHYLILALMEGNETLTYQLVNYGQLEPKFRQLLEQNGGKVMIQG